MGAGIAFVVLNFLRCLMMASLSLACVASIVCIAGLRSDVSTYFFNILGSTYRLLACVLLILCELPPGKTARSILATRLPLLCGRGHSLAWLGSIGLVLAASLLADLRLPPLNQRSIDVAGLTSAAAAHNASSTGLPHAWHSVVFAAGISLGILSIIYCLLPLVFWSAPHGEDRRLRHDGAAGASESPLDYNLRRGNASDSSNGGEWAPEVPLKISRPLHPSASSANTHSAGAHGGDTYSDVGVGAKSEQSSRSTSYGSAKSGQSHYTTTADLQPPLRRDDPNAVEYTRPLVYTAQNGHFAKAWLR